MSRAPAEDVLKHFTLRPNIAEAVASNETLKRTALGHVPVGDLLDVEADPEMSKKRAIAKLRSKGFTVFYEMTHLELSKIDKDGFEPVVNGMRDFSRWTSFNCRKEREVVFAFESVKDAVLFRMHV